MLAGKRRKKNYKNKSRKQRDGQGADMSDFGVFDLLIFIGFG